MKDLTVRWGATLNITIENDEDTADTATLTVSQDDTVVITKTASFVDGSADVSLDADETEITPGEYEYMIKVEYTDGTVEKYPTYDNCTDCELPKIQVCDTNDNPEVS